jgi:hypothetical protein
MTFLEQLDAHFVKAIDDSRSCGAYLKTLRRRDALWLAKIMGAPEQYRAAQEKLAPCASPRIAPVP